MTVQNSATRNFDRSSRDSMPGEIRSALSSTLSNYIAEKKQEQFGGRLASPPDDDAAIADEPRSVERERRERCDIAKDDSRQSLITQHLRINQAATAIV